MLLLRKIWYGFKVLFVSFQQPGFAIRRGYLHRKSVTDFIDQGNTDEYQKEVYVFARRLFDEKELSGVLDIGCGSAFKLLANFDNVPKAGAELSTDWLKQKYPSEIWFAFSDKEWKQFPAQLIICADVIKHVPNPDAFIADLLEQAHAKYFVFSTPDRNLDTSPWIFGPPNNESHYREWTFEEFASYISRHFQIVHHTISKREQRTQMLVAERK